MAKRNMPSKENDLRKDMNMRIWLVLLATRAKTNSFLYTERAHMFRDIVQDM